jgi:hypothetical protein
LEGAEGRLLLLLQFGRLSSLYGAELLRNTVVLAGARCPKCRASRLASELTPEDKLLLTFRAELKMLERVAAYHVRHPNGRKEAGGPNWTLEDEQVADFLKRHFFSIEPRLKFVTGRKRN